MCRQRLAQDGVEGDLAGFQPELLRPQPGQVHDVAQEQLQAGRLVADDPYGVAPGGLVGNGAVPERLDVAPDGGERCAELVGDIGEELVLAPAGLGEGPGHVVELTGQVGHLVVALDRHPVSEVAGGQVVGGLGHLPKGLGEPPGDPQRHRHGDEHRDGSREQHPADHGAPDRRRQTDRPREHDTCHPVGAATRDWLGDVDEGARCDGDGALHRAAVEDELQVDGRGHGGGDGVVADDPAGRPDVDHPVPGALEELAEGGGHRAARGGSAGLPGDGVGGRSRRLPLELGEGLLLGVLPHEAEGDQRGAGDRERRGEAERGGQASPEAPAPHQGRIRLLPCSQRRAAS